MGEAPVEAFFIIYLGFICRGAIGATGHLNNRTPQRLKFSVHIRWRVGLKSMVKTNAMLQLSMLKT